jgi:hypothetical protein
MAAIYIFTRDGSTTTATTTVHRDYETCTDCTMTIDCTACFSFGCMGPPSRAIRDEVEEALNKPEHRMWPRGCVPIDEHCKQPFIKPPKQRYELGWLKYVGRPFYAQTRRRHTRQKPNRSALSQL